MDHTYLTLPERLFSPSAVESFFGELLLPEITMGADTYQFVGPVQYILFITNTGGAFLVTGTVNAETKTACARCLDPVDLSIDAEVESYFLIPDKEIDFTEDEEVEYDHLVGRNKIDLTELCTAALALAFPYIPLCSENCKGLCPECGTNLNHETCDCAQTKDDIDPMNPFAVLKNLKLDSE